jgi:hypothetical protein
MGLQSYINKALISIPEASHSTLKAFVKFGKAKTGAEQSSYFNKLKPLSYSSFHLNPTDFFTISVIDATIVPSQTFYKSYQVHENSLL